jgi:hypothetical protein
LKIYFKKKYCDFQIFLLKKKIISQKVFLDEKKMVFTVPEDYTLAYRTTANRVICIVFQQVDECKFKYGASIFKQGNEKWSLKEIKSKIRVTALGRMQKNPVTCELLPEEMDSDIHLVDLLRSKLHTHGVCGKGKQRKNSTPNSTPQATPPKVDSAQ